MKLLGNTGKYDFVITEIGGTVGDIESLPFLEAVRQLRWELGQNCLVVHLTYVPFIKAAKELKTKPTQHSVKQLQEVGIQPDILVLRTEQDIPMSMRKKVALFCNVSPDAVIQSIDAPTIYAVPLQMHEQHLDEIVLKKTNTPYSGEPDLTRWNEFLDKIKNATDTITIGLVGKYVSLQDAYKSITESLFQAATYNDRKLDLRYVNSEKLNDENVGEALREMDGVIVAPGFGQRGVEGKFVALKWCREHDVPTFGICLGMQCAVIEYARNVAGLKGANSTEFDENASIPVIDLMLEQKNVKGYGGTMRLGAYDCHIKKGTKAHEVYDANKISERHRHRYEVNTDYIEQLKKAGLVFSGMSPDGMLSEIVELPDLDWFVACQFHPEFKSRPERPHPLFKGLIDAVVKQKSAQS